jgi:hypothetical protein
MKKILFALFVTLSLASSACGVETELSPPDSQDAVGAAAPVAVESSALSAQTCRAAWEACLEDTSSGGDRQCVCDNEYRHCMHRPQQMCQEQ